MKVIDNIAKSGKTSKFEENNVISFHLDQQQLG